MANDPQTPQSSPFRRGRLVRVFLAVTASLSLLVGIASTAGFSYYKGIESDLQRGDSNTTRGSKAIGEVHGSEVGGPCQEHGCNFLVLGSDSRQGLSREEQKISGTNADIGGTQRSDTIIVVHVEAGTEEATILHFPRDLWLQIPGHGKDKINAAFEGGVNGGGPQVVASTVQRLTGLHINHWLYVDLAGFEGVVDALGGVKMCVPTPMYDELTGLAIGKPGCYTFNGSEALSFVRTRHFSVTPGGAPCDAIPDFARISRQQQFLRAVLAKILSPGELLHLGDIVHELVKNFVVDKSFTLADMGYLVDKLKGVNTGDADFRVVPSVPAEKKVPEYSFPLSIVRMLPEAKLLFERLREGKPLGVLGKEQVDTPPSPANIQVQLYDHNAGAKVSEALKVLEESGFAVAPQPAPFTDLETNVTGSALLFRHGEQEMADVVRGYLPSLKAKEVPGRELSTPVAVVVSSGYRTVEPGQGGGGGGQPSCPGT